MKGLPQLLVLLALGFIISTNSSCRKDIGQSDGSLEFSVDTVIFDTVFTTVGSVTRRFMIYNRESQPVTISSAILAGGLQSKYRINIDGMSGVALSDIEIPAEDSLFAFVEVTLDPNNQLDPAMVIDSIVFNTNGVQQDVDLVACGWDAHFISPTFNLGGLGPTSVIGCDTTWTAGKPIVIYGYAAVDSACTLTMMPGTQVYIHKYSGIFVFTEGSLQILGEVGNEVKIQSDRIDEFYADQAGEWDRIWLFQGSRDNVINNAIIKNGNVGIQADTISPNSANPTVRMHNVLIENMAAASLFAQSASVEATNCVFGNAGQYSAALTIGGSYSFKHCTFGNSWPFGNRQTPALLVNNWFEDITGTIQVRDLNNAYFGNCIVYGNNLNEVLMDKVDGSNFNFQFEKCLLRVDPDDQDATTSEFVDCILNDDPNFVDAVENNFELDTLSPAKDVGLQSIVLTDFNLEQDILGTPRLQSPDLGAYERVE
jgi:hypothetical protein